MKHQGKTGWIVGIVLASLLCVFMLILCLATLSETESKTNGPTMSASEMSARCYRASELFCAGVYYTDKALSADPQQISYDKWQEYVNKANKYWSALDDTLAIIEGYAGTNSFQESFEDTALKNNVFESLSNMILPKAYAMDSAEILKVFDGAKAGQRLKAVADFLGKDMAYAQSALKMANGEITSESWNNFADTAKNLEAAARVTKTAAQGTFLVLGAPAAGTAALSAEGAMFAVSGASLIWQATDDACFIAMGDKYDTNEFVVNLGKVSDAVATMTFASGMLSMDFSKVDDAIMSSYEFAETLRGVIQDGKVAGIQFKGSSGNVVNMTKDEFLKYQQAKKDGETLPDEITPLLDMLNNKPTKPEELPTFTLNANKKQVKIEEWVAFTVADTKPEYSYIWEYGNNKNPKDSKTFEYMYQKAGTYTMYVTVLNENGEPVGRGSCTIKVVDEPEPTVLPTQPPVQQSADSKDKVNEINIIGRYSYRDETGYDICEFNADGTYLRTVTYSDSDYVDKMWGTYMMENSWVDEDGKTYYKFHVDVTGTSTGHEGIDFAPCITSDDIDKNGNVMVVGDYKRE